jgi:kynurenine formamidase
MQYIDLTHALLPDIPSWDGSCCFHLKTTVDYKDCTKPNLFRVQEIACKAGAGTHMDAPAHCFSDATTIDGLQLPHLITNCVVMHVDEAADENTLVMPEAVTAFE